MYLTNSAARAALAIVFLFAATLPTLCSNTSCCAALVYSHFPNSDGLSLVHDAATINNILRVSPALQSHWGAAWFTTRQPVATGFETAFQFRLSELGEFGPFVPGGDGFTFTIQNVGLNAIGNFGPFGGASLGWSGILNSVSVQFKTSIVFDSPLDQAVRVHVWGNQPDGPETQLATTGPAFATNLSDLDVHTARITYEPGVLRVFLDSDPTALLTVPVDLASSIPLFNGSAYVGFTAASGALTENHDILNWSFTSVPEPSTLALAALGLLGLLIAARRKR